MKIKVQEKKTINILYSDVVTSGRANGDEGVIKTFVSVVNKFFMPSVALDAFCSES